MLSLQVSIERKILHRFGRVHSWQGKYDKEGDSYNDDGDFDGYDDDSGGGGGVGGVVYIYIYIYIYPDMYQHNF